MITFVKCPVCSDGNSFQTLELAQSHEIELILKEIPFSPESRIETIKCLISNSAKIVDILTTTPTSLNKARRVNGGKKTRKPKTTTEATV